MAGGVSGGFRHSAMLLPLLTVVSQQEKEAPRPTRTIRATRVPPNVNHDQNHCASVARLAAREAQAGVRRAGPKLNYDSCACACATVALPPLASATGQAGFQATGFLPTPMGTREGGPAARALLRLHVDCLEEVGMGRKRCFEMEAETIERRQCVRRRYTGSKGSGRT